MGITPQAQDPAVSVSPQSQLSTEFASDIQYLVSCVMYGCNSIHPNL